MKRNIILEKIVGDMGLMHREIAARHNISYCPAMTYTEMHVIRHIYEADGSGIKDIALKLKVSSSAITQTVNKMIDKGYLTRKDNDTDRRHLSLSLTPELKTKYKQIMNNNYEHIAEAFSVLTDEELALLSNLVEKITLNINRK